MHVVNPAPRSWWLLTAALAAGACGGADDTSGTVDAAIGDDGPAEVDAPSCLPALPSSMVLAGDAAMPPSYTHLPVLTSSGELAVFGYDGTSGEAARFWDGTAWSTQQVWSSSNGGFGRIASGEIAGRAVLFGDISDSSSDSDKLRFWLQLEGGAFATGARVGNATSAEIRVSRYDATAQLLSAAGGDQSQVVQSYERNAAGVWTVATVYSTTPGSVYAAGVGTLADGTAVIASAGAAGFLLHRRAGLQWSQYRTLASGAIYHAHLEFPTAGATGTAAVGIYEDAVTHHPRGVFVDLASGMASGAADLLPEAIGTSSIDSQIVYEPGTARGKILLVDSNFNGPRAWIIGFEGTSFTAAHELRPDRVFETYPHLFYHPCGGYQILHVSRVPTDAAGSAPLLLEALSTFAPGL